MMNTDQLSGESHFQLGDTVKVRDGYYDSEFNIDMSGWHGRVREFYPEAGTAVIHFDSLTLLDIPSSYIEQCEMEGYSWSEYGFDLHDLVKTDSRDKRSDVQYVLKELRKLYLYSYLGPEGREINKIFGSLDPDQTLEPLDVWETYLQENLAFPFEAVVDELQERGPLSVGDKLRVSRIELADEQYGLIVKVHHDSKQFSFPLCDLAAADVDSTEFDLIRLYHIWYANQ